MSDQDDYLKTYEEFWKEIVEVDGVLNVDQVKRELHDYSRLLDNVPKVYSYVTGGMASKPNTDASVIKALHDDEVTRLCEEAVKDAREEDAESKGAERA